MPATPVIYHNPRCSKSRATLTLLTERGLQPQVIHYLDTPPDQATLQQLLRQLGFSSARELMRRKESVYQQLNLDDPALSEAELLEAMVRHPILIERPIVVWQDQARIGRPPEAVLELF